MEMLELFVAIISLIKGLENIPLIRAEDSPPVPIITPYVITGGGNLVEVPLDADGTGLFTFETNNRMETFVFTCTFRNPVEWEFECPEDSTQGPRTTHEVTYNNNQQYMSNLTMIAPRDSYFSGFDSVVNATCRIIELPNVNSSVILYGSSHNTMLSITSNWWFNSSQNCGRRTPDCPITLNINLDNLTFFCESHANDTEVQKKLESCSGQLDYCKSMSKGRCVNFVSGSGGESVVAFKPWVTAGLLKCVNAKDNSASLMIYIANNWTAKRIALKPGGLADDKGAMSLRIITNSSSSDGFYYDGQEVKLECEFKSTLFYMGSVISYKFDNGSTIVIPSLRRDEIIFDGWIIRISFIKMAKDIRSITCNCSILGSGLWRHESLNVNVTTSSKPKIIHHNMGLNLCGTWFECNATGFPAPKIRWQTRSPRSSSQMLEETLCMDEPKVFVEEKETYTFNRLQLPIWYNISASGLERLIELCEAENVHGQDKFAFMEEDSEDNYSGVISLLITVILVACLSVIVVQRIRFRKQLRKLSKEEMDEFFNGNADIASPNLDGTNLHLIPYDASFEIPTEHLVTGNAEMLGCGEFSYVIKGRVKPSLILVAVKISKPSSDPLIFKAALLEVKIMIHIGQHPNVVELIGVNTSGIINRKLLICMEYCSLGNLKSYVRMHKPQITTQSSDFDTDPVSYQQMTKWAFEIANGMEHLSSKSIVHADLAARNCLLHESLCVKISDFGLSRKLYEEQNYRKMSKGPLPWRWMPIESLKSFTFSTKSDVYSYGITLFEIFSYGETPFPNELWDAGFASRLEAGLRLDKPSLASQEIYELMLKCWDSDPADRPNFTELKLNLQSYLDASSEYAII